MKMRIERQDARTSRKETPRQTNQLFVVLGVFYLGVLASWRSLTFSQLPPQGLNPESFYGKDSTQGVYVRDSAVALEKHDLGAVGMLKHCKPLVWPVELHDEAEYVPPERQSSIVVKDDQFGNCLRPVAWRMAWHHIVL